MQHPDCGNSAWSNPLSPPATATSKCSPLSVRRIYQRAFSLYWGSLAQYLMLSVQGHLWLFLTFVLGLTGFYWGIQTPAPSEMAAAGAAAIAGLLGFYGLAGYWAYAGSMAQMAYRQIAVQPNSWSQTRTLQRRRLTFGLLAVGMAGILSITLGLAYLGLHLAGSALYFLWRALTGIAVLMLGLVQLEAAYHLIVVWVTLLAFLALLGMGWLLLRFLLRFCLAEVVLVLKPTTTSWESLGASWGLTRRSGRFLMRWTVVFWGTTLPLQIPAQGFSGFVLHQLQAQVPFLQDLPTNFVTLLAVGVGAELVGILLLPLWQISKTILYYHWRPDAIATSYSPSLFLEGQAVADPDLDC